MSDIISKKYNECRFKILKTETNNQENDSYFTSSEIKELIKNSKLKELKNIFINSKFYDNEFIKYLLLLYKNKTPIKNLNYEISKDKKKNCFRFSKKLRFFIEWYLYNWKWE